MSSRLYNRTLTNVANLRLTTRCIVGKIRAATRRIVRDISVFRDGHAIRSPVNKIIIVLLFVLPLIYLAVLERRIQADLGRTGASLTRVSESEYNSRYLAAWFSAAVVSVHSEEHVLADATGF